MKTNKDKIIYVLSTLVIILTIIIVFLTKQQFSNKSKISNLNTQINQLQNSNETLENELENGSKKLLVDVRNAFEKKEYDKVIKLSNDVHNKYNGSKEDQEAKTLSMQAQTILDEEANQRKIDEELKLAEMNKSKEEKIHNIIKITKLSHSSPNSAGGVDLFIGYKNMSDNIIKYCSFTITPYNAVGDIVYSRIGNTSTVIARDEGPHSKGEGIAGNYNWYWQNEWYAWNINTLVLDEIFIEYMDGSSIRLTGDDLNYVQW